MSSRRQPDLATIGGRLMAERHRMGLSQPSMAALAGVTKSGLVKWENGSAAPNAFAFSAFSEAGADVLFIITGRHDAGHEVHGSAAEHPLAGVTVRQALAMLDPVDRHRLLLDLLAEELRG